MEVFHNLETIFKEFDLGVVKCPCDFDDVKTRIHAPIKSVFNKVILGGTADAVLFGAPNGFAPPAIGVGQAKFDFDEVVDGFKCFFAEEFFVLNCDDVNFAVFVAIVVLHKFKTALGQKNACQPLACPAFCAIELLDFVRGLVHQSKYTAGLGGCKGNWGKENESGDRKLCGGIWS